MDMIHNIRASFTELLAEVPWMDDETKKFAKEKVFTLFFFLNYDHYNKKNLGRKANSIIYVNKYT